MFYDKRVILFKKSNGTTTDEYGIVIPEGDLLVGSYPMDVQPVTQRVVKYEFGLDVECKYRCWCDSIIPITKESLIGYEGNLYEVKEILKWDDYSDFIVASTGKTYTLPDTTEPSSEPEEEEIDNG